MNDRFDLTDPTNLALELARPFSDLDPTSRATIDATVRLWEAFADTHGLDPDTATITPVTLAAFTLARLTTDVRHNTVERDLWALTRAHQAATGSFPHIDVVARAVIRGWLLQEPPKPVEQAAVLPRWFLGEMAMAIRDGEPGYDFHGEWRAARDRAVLALGYAGALRASSIASVERQHLRRDADQYRLWLPTSKGNQPNANGWRDETLAIRPLTGAFDPVGLLDDWLDIRGDQPGALFPAAPDELDFLIGERTIRDRLQAVAERCGDHQQAYTTAGLRRTWATHARLEGRSVREIGKHLCHRSTHVTQRYVADLEAFVTDGNAKRYYLSTVRPADASYDFGGTSKKSFGTRWQPPGTGLDELTGQATDLAREGVVSAALVSRNHARQIRARFDKFAADAGADPMNASEDLVAAFAIHEWRRPQYTDASKVGLRAVTIRRYIEQLALSWVLDDPTVVPPTGRAIAVMDALVRRESAAPQTQAPIPPDGEAALLRMLEVRAPKDRDLNAAVLRWHSHRAGKKLIRPGRRNATPLPWEQLTPETVTVHDDHVTLVVEGRKMQLSATGSPATCPVRAARSLLADSEGNGQLLERITFGGNGSMLREYLGLTTCVEKWDRTQFEAATSWLAGGLRRHRRDQMVVGVLYAAALRGADLRGARIEDLERYEFGYLLHLRQSKENRRGEPETVPLLKRDDALCPVGLIDRFLEVWPEEEGPLLPGRCGDRSHTDGAEPEAMSRRNLLTVLDTMGAAVGVSVTGHSFRRLAATLLWEETEDLDTVQRKLRHRNQKHTARYVEQLTPRAPRLQQAPKNAPAKAVR